MFMSELISEPREISDSLAAHRSPPSGPNSPASLFGERNQFVFGEILGLSDEEIERLKEGEIIR